MSLLQFLFSFQGRVRRLHLWLFFLVLSVLYGGVFWQFRHWGLGDHSGHVMDMGGIWIVFHTPVGLIFGILAAWAKLAVLVKRWHDRDKSGWWVLINLIPVIGWIWQLIECGFLDGTQGPNRFGASPKGVGYYQ